jgi:hypothetical protein
VVITGLRAIVAALLIAHQALEVAAILLAAATLGAEGTTKSQTCQ